MIYTDGEMLPDPFLEKDLNREQERGLLGLAFDPDFETNQYLYVFYTGPDDMNRISRFTADGNQVVPNSEYVLMVLEPMTSNFHNGGALAFGPDGKLYVGVGDGGNTPDEAQRLDSRSGVILRLNKDGSIPQDNPFYETAEGHHRAIWAYGLRNPFSLAFDRETGELFINDVGEFAREEINKGEAGANYGWPIFEGEVVHREGETPSDYVPPIYDYPRGDSTCAITGGEVYRPSVPNFPQEYVGDYFFTDFCSDRIWRYDPETGDVSDFVTGLDRSIIDIVTGPDGSLYYLRYPGVLRRLTFVGTRDE